MDDVKQPETEDENSESPAAETAEAGERATEGPEQEEIEPSAPGADPAPMEETTEDFAKLLGEAPSQREVRWRKGEKIAAKVVRVADEWVFVSLGGKEEGSIRTAEFDQGESAAAGAEAGEGAGLPREGQEIEAYVLSSADGEVVLTTKLSGRNASLATLEQAWQAGIPVEGRVVKSIKGGYEVRISGLRGFCPLSQIDLRWAKSPDVHVNQTYPFKILEFKEKGRNIILSRRVLLEQEREQQREQLRETVMPGAVISGVVRSIQNFGAFVDIGGVDGLIPVSELSWGHVKDPTAVLSDGQEVEVKVLDVDWDRERVSLSLRALEGDPWEGLEQKYQPGQRVAGTVARLSNFGAFVTLEPGIDGLVHISALGAGKRVGHPKEVVQVGEQVEVEVLSLDPDKRKISLSMEHRYLESLGPLPAVGQVVSGTVEKVLDFGVFVGLPSGHTGLVPNAEMGTPKGTAHREMFKPGDAMDVQVKDVEDGGKRIRLSRKDVAEQGEARIVEDFRAAQDDAGASMGTLGDLFRAKLQGRK